MKALLTTTLFLFTFNCSAGPWYKVEGEVEFPNITEQQLEDLIWTEIKSMENDGVYPREQYSYQYHMKDKDTLYVLGLCKISNFFKNVDLTKQLMSVRDGGKCYINAKYYSRTNKIEVWFNGLA